jgi:hypothetical protein
MTWQPLMAFDQNIQAIETCLQQYCQTDCDNRSSMYLFPPDVCTAAVMPSPIDGGQDAAPPTHDAGRPPGADAGSSHDAATGSGSGSGGCGHCDLAPGAAGGPAGWSLLLVAAGLRPRRRRR